MADFKRAAFVQFLQCSFTFSFRIANIFSLKAEPSLKLVGCNVSNLLDSLSRCLKLVGCTRRSEIQCLRRCVDTESLCKHDQLARIKGSKANTRQTLSHKWMEKRPAGCVGWNVSMRFPRPVKDHPVVRLLGADRYAVAVEGAAGEPGEGATGSNSNHVHVVPSMLVTLFLSRRSMAVIRKQLTCIPNTGIQDTGYRDWWRCSWAEWAWQW